METPYHEKATVLFSKVMDIVTNATQTTFQIYVISLGNSGSFGKEEQAIAFDKAKVIITSEFREKLKTFITQNYGDLQKWFTNQIEETIYESKN